MHTIERLKELLDYDPETGIFKWKVKRGKLKPGDIAGGPDAKGHIKIKIDGKMYRANRLAWQFHHGEIPDGYLIDHKNRVRDDNRIDNLRLATHKQNSVNTKIGSNNTSGYKGVVKCGNRWSSRIADKHLGTFDCPVEAHEVYMEASKEMYGEFVGEFLSNGKEK